MNKTLSNVVICTTLLLIIGVGGWYVFTNYFNGAIAQPIVNEPSEIRTHLPGSFILTLQPSLPDNAVAGIYRILATGGAPQNEKDTTDFYVPSFSSDGRVAVVVNDGDELSQLLISDINEPGSAYSITPPAPALFAGSSDWSADNMYIVYEGVTALPSEDDMDIENSRIIVLNTETEEQAIIDVGSSPVFYNDGSILYLKNDGVYRMTYDAFVAGDGSERVLLFEEYEAARNSRIALSADGSKLAITHPNSSLFLTYQVFGGDTFALSDGSGVVQTAFWPVFSPDGSSIAFIDMKENDAGIITKALAVVELVSGKQRTVTDLSSYNDVYLSLNAWVQ